MTKSLGDKSFPVEYIEFQFCREFGILPHQLEEMSHEDFVLYCGFMRAEGEAAKIREMETSNRM